MLCYSLAYNTDVDCFSTSGTTLHDCTGWNDPAHARVPIGSRVYGGYAGERFRRGDRSSGQGETEAQQRKRVGVHRILHDVV